MFMGYCAVAGPDLPFGLNNPIGGDIERTREASQMPANRCERRSTSHRLETTTSCHLLPAATDGQLCCILSSILIGENCLSQRILGRMPPLRVRGLRQTTCRVPLPRLMAATSQHYQRMATSKPLLALSACNIYVHLQAF